MLRIFTLLYLLGMGLFFSALLVPIFRRVAFRLGITDRPGQRKIHDQPKPLLGGLAIAGAFYLTIVLNLSGLFLFKNVSFVSHVVAPYLNLVSKIQARFLELSCIAAGSLVIVILGLIDDVRGETFPYQVKFLVQFLSVGILFAGGVRTQFMPGQILDFVVTAVWIVGIANAFNLMDNMDGLSAGVAAIASLLFAVIVFLQGQLFTAFIFVALAGSLLGFLLFNWYPSKIFMGDAGSLFIGYMLGTLTVISSYITPESQTAIPVIIPLLVLSVPIYDTFSVMVIRWREHRPLFVGDKKHFSHRLVALGMRQTQAVFFIYVVTLTVGMVAVLLPGAKAWESWVLLAQAVLILSLVTFLMHINQQGG
ncbi:MAG: undecaprenyl/decaprenyl-phosphate alpha-N-acetylglucosaminyl 1-phosphate transferase [Calditrichaeota bacterium]|nr:undecaprenyl/decaprenyl-phosphate alpha-N-acetylglucosaminyl 1-phosphate transferase [Calditrichota bacterium]